MLAKAIQEFVASHLQNADAARADTHQLGPHDQVSPSTFELDRAALFERHRPPPARVAAPEPWVGPWLVIISAPLGAFFASFMAEAGKDAYVAFKRLISKIFAKARDAHKDESVEVFLQDPISKLLILIEPDIPRAAYEQLLTIRLPVLPNDYVVKQCLRWNQASWTLEVEVPIQVVHIQGSEAVILTWLPDKHRWTTN